MKQLTSTLWVGFLDMPGIGSEQLWMGEKLSLKAFFAILEVWAQNMSTLTEQDDDEEEHEEESEKEKMMKRKQRKKKKNKKRKKQKMGIINQD